jgi:hypothetical protein
MLENMLSETGLQILSLDLCCAHAGWACPIPCVWRVCGVSIGCTLNALVCNADFFKIWPYCLCSPGSGQAMLHVSHVLVPCLGILPSQRQWARYVWEGTLPMWWPISGQPNDQTSVVSSTKWTGPARCITQSAGLGPQGMFPATGGCLSSMVRENGDGVVTKGPHEHRSYEE